MKQEEKDLLLRDLCARLPYNVQGVTSDGVVSPQIVKGEADWDFITSLNYRIVKHGWKPYLRPMSSMTEEEEKEEFQEYIFDSNEIGEIVTLEASDWLNKNMFDYRGLIEKGLALEAPEGMYNVK